MSSVSISPVGNAQVDEIIARLIAAYELEFGGHDLSYYLIGSWVDGATNDLSDIDLIVVWGRETPDEPANQRAAEITHAIDSPIRLDVVMVAESDLWASTVGANLKLACFLLHGSDIRERLPLPPFPQYRQGTIDTARDFVFHHLRGIPAGTLPLVYPAPDEEFFGYDRKRIDAWYPTSVERGLKEFVSTGTRVARALVALQGPHYVGSKGAAIAVYRQVIGDGWSEYLDTLYRKGKIEWGHRVPCAEADRRVLHHLCKQFLHFERHFLHMSAQYPVS